DDAIRAVGTGEWSVVQVKSDRRRVAADCGNSSHLECGLTWPAGLHGYAGNGSRQRVEVGQAPRFDVRPGHGRDADGRGLNRRLTLGRRYHYFLELRIRRGIALLLRRSIH